MAMKRLLIVLAAVGIVFFTSCERDKEITSLEGTTWEHRYEYNDGSWSEIELKFTATHATYTRTNSANKKESFTGTYTFDPPNVVIVDDVEAWHEGMVRGRTMEIGIRESPDLVMIVFLEMQ
jgi:hypothetical protein